MLEDGMTTLIIKHDQLIADRLIVRPQGGGITRRSHKSKIIKSECERLAFISRNRLIDKEVVALFTRTFLTVLQEALASCTEIKLTVQEVGGDEIASQLKFYLDTQSESTFTLLTSEGALKIYVGDDLFCVERYEKGDVEYFGTGAVFASTVAELTDDLAEIYKVTALCDEATSEEHDVVTVSDLKPLTFEVIDV